MLDSRFCLFSPCLSKKNTIFRSWELRYVKTNGRGKEENEVEAVSKKKKKLKMAEKKESRTNLRRVNLAVSSTRVRFHFNWMISILFIVWLKRQSSAAFRKYPSEFSTLMNFRSAGIFIIIIIILFSPSVPSDWKYTGLIDFRIRSLHTRLSVLILLLFHKSIISSFSSRFLFFRSLLASIPFLFFFFFTNPSLWAYLATKLKGLSLLRIFRVKISVPSVEVLILKSSTINVLFHLHRFLESVFYYIYSPLRT